MTYTLKSVPADVADFTAYGGALEFLYNHDPEVVIHGPAECVAGETLIHDCATGLDISIQDLAETQTAPIVKTLYGQEKAGIPFCKGTAKLFRVTLESGVSFLATKNHYVLTDFGWLPVGLLGISSTLFSVLRISFTISFMVFSH